MRVVECVVDIATRKVDKAFTYKVPAHMDVRTGQTLVVPFAGRMQIAFAMCVRDASATDPLDKLKEVRQILSESAFDKVAAELIYWIADEYAANLSDAVKLFVAPGQSLSLKKLKDGSFVLQDRSVRQKDESWLRLGANASTFVPSAKALMQKKVVDELREGPKKQSDVLSKLPSARSSINRLVELGVVEKYSERAVRAGADTTTLSSAKAIRPKAYSKEQTLALSIIREATQAEKGDVVLVDGVTGSGKTEVYLAAIEEVLAKGKEAIVLVPEISLTAQTVGRFRSRFGQNVAILHSRLSQGERFDQWDLLREGRAHVVVGARSALFAPLQNVGLIIIDEEHESSYKQDSSPRYHAREVAEHLARLRGAALVLGSATPSLEALARCANGTHRGVRWIRTTMFERAGGAKLPEVELVNLAEQKASGAHPIFSHELKEALLKNFSENKKSVILLNRRGFANFLMCQDCGCVPECPYCSEALTYHERGHMLMCHSCGRFWPTVAYPDPMARCPNCGSRYMGAFGVGTQRVEDELYALLGRDATVIRMDADTTKNKGGHQSLLEKFDKAQAAVLLGTQMIAKGLDFPDVTLVGVINADTMLKLPDFRAQERTYDLLEQVAGRAGRGQDRGKVIIQSYWSAHPAILSVKTRDRDSFVTQELAARKEAGYPPYGRVSNIIIWGTSEVNVGNTSQDIYQVLCKMCPHSWEFLGPSECLKARINNRYRKHIVVKSEADANVGPALKAAVLSVSVPEGINIAIDIDAYDLM